MSAPRCRIFTEDLKKLIREAHYDGYMSGMMDSEDYDHDATVMERIRWEEFWYGKSEGN